MVTTCSMDWWILLSARKPELSFFSPNLHKSKWQSILTLDRQPVHYVATQKFLGVTYDRQITFSGHAALVGNGLMGQAGSLQKLASTSWGSDHQQPLCNLYYDRTLKGGIRHIIVVAVGF